MSYEREVQNIGFQVKVRKSIGQSEIKKLEEQVRKCPSLIVYTYAKYEIKKCLHLHLIKICA